MNNTVYESFHLFDTWAGNSMSEDDADKVIIGIKNTKMPRPTNVPIIRAAATIGLPENDFVKLSSRINDITNKNSVLKDTNGRIKSSDDLLKWNDLKLKTIQTDENGNSILFSEKTGMFYEYNNMHKRPFGEMIKDGVPYSDFMHNVKRKITKEFYNPDDIATEKITTNILEPGLGPTITLFHGSDIKFDVVKANSVNMGNRLERKQLSSFWTNNFEYAAIHSVDWIFEEHGVFYGHRIADAKIIIPDVEYSEGKAFRKGESNGGTQSLDFIRKILKGKTTYVYEASIPVKYVGRGQVPIDEYSVDVDVVPSKIHEITYDYIKARIEMMSYEDFLIAKKKGMYSKDHINLRERIIFRNPRKTLSKRARNYSAYQKMLEKRKSSEVLQG